MATSHVPAASAAAASVVANLSASSSSSSCLSSSQLFPRLHANVAFRLSLTKPKLIFSHKTSRLNCNHPAAFTQAQLDEVVGGRLNDAAAVKSKPEVPPSQGEDVESTKKPSTEVSMSEESVSEFLTQVSSLVKLVDSKDIVELQLKQADCEVIIRKKEVLPQPPVPVVMMPPVTPPGVMPAQQFPPPPPALPTPAGATASSLAPPTSSSPQTKAAKSSHPPLKSPMSGTFYKCSGPGQPPFVKVGDKVSKGQVLCIIEAMKLMNEIEADQSGTVVEILVDDGKPVGVEQPLFVIAP